MGLLTARVRCRKKKRRDRRRSGRRRSGKRTMRMMICLQKRTWICRVTRTERRTGRMTLCRVRTTSFATHHRLAFSGPHHRIHVRKICILRVDKHKKNNCDRTTVKLWAMILWSLVKTDFATHHQPHPQNSNPKEEKANKMKVISTNEWQMKPRKEVREFYHNHSAKRECHTGCTQKPN